jgi:hypothetical protein
MAIMVAIEEVCHIAVTEEKFAILYLMIVQLAFL